MPLTLLTGKTSRFVTRVGERVNEIILLKTSTILNKNT